jgi:hypothetical protein
VAGGTQPSRRHGECFRAIDERTNEERAAIGHELVFVGLELSQVLATRELTERLMDELPELVAAGDGRASELAGRLRSFGVNPVAPAYSYRASPGTSGCSTHTDHPSGQSDGGWITIVSAAAAGSARRQCSHFGRRGSRCSSSHDSNNCKSPPRSISVLKVGPKRRVTARVAPENPTPCPHGAPTRLLNPDQQPELLAQLSRKSRAL